MIVRESSSCWLLISQVEHARIAAEIAANWRLPAALEGLRPQFLSAVEHHDDGWREWEQAPTIDDDGDPRDFMEMPMPIATAIWTASIDVAARSSPWSGLWISRHFCYLAELTLEHRDDPGDRSAAQEFLKEQFAAQRRWRAEVDARDVTEIEVAGLHALQFFDRVSLWLCCAERTAEQMFPDPAGGTTHWTPESAESIRVSGDNFTADALSLSVRAVAIERRPYADDAELREGIAGGQHTTIPWSLHRE
jgi:hypothetical protein